jgi:hypothetical protein
MPATSWQLVPVSTWAGTIEPWLTNTFASGCHNDDFSRAIQLAIEYDPDPPFDSGSPQKAPDYVVELVRAALTDSTRREAVAAGR